MQDNISQRFPTSFLFLLNRFAINVHRPLRARSSELRPIWNTTRELNKVWSITSDRFIQQISQDNSLTDYFNKYLNMKYFIDILNFQCLYTTYLQANKQTFCLRILLFNFERKKNSKILLSLWKFSKFNS